MQRGSDHKSWEKELRVGWTCCCGDFAFRDLGFEITSDLQLGSLGNAGNDGKVVSEKWLRSTPENIAKGSAFLQLSKNGTHAINVGRVQRVLHGGQWYSRASPSLKLIQERLDTEAKEQMTLKEEAIHCLAALEALPGVRSAACPPHQDSSWTSGDPNPLCTFPKVLGWKWEEVCDTKRGVLRYKREVYCNMSNSLGSRGGRGIAVQSGVIVRYKEEAYSAVLFSRLVGVGVSETLLKVGVFRSGHKVRVQLSNIDRRSCGRFAATLGICRWHACWCECYGMMNVPI